MRSYRFSDVSLVTGLVKTLRQVGARIMASKRTNSGNSTTDYIKFCLPHGATLRLEYTTTTEKGETIL